MVFEIFHELVVLARQVVGDWEEIECLRLLNAGRFVQFSFMFFDVADKEVLSCQLLMVSEVVNALVRFEVRVDQYGVDVTLVDPNYVPGVILSLFVAFSFKGIEYAVSEGSLKFYL